MKDSNRKAMFAGQKRTGLNKVTVQELKTDGKYHNPPLYQVKMNGKGSHWASKAELTKEYLTSDIISAKNADKRGYRIGFDNPK